MPHPTAVILVVGLNRSLIGDWSPNLRTFIDNGTLRTHQPVLPAVTCSVQSSILTGTTPDIHGIVGNGWYDYDHAEVRFWKQSNHLVRGKKIWDIARERDPSVTTANLFWWYNMYSSVDYSVTPRPMYKADGRKMPDIYTNPPALRNILQHELGEFPLLNFWGPGASIESSRWIADAAMLVYERRRPMLSLVYLPHLDYCLQKYGPNHPEISGYVTEIDNEFGRLIDFYHKHGVRVMTISEYGIEPVNEAVHINRILRREGLLRVREEQGLEQLDAGASDAFAVVDHQIAHIYVQDATRIQAVSDLLSSVDGIEYVLSDSEQASQNIRHERSGDLVAIASRGKWFDYHFWLDDNRAPDYARTVDIHRKPGYDPLELFVDPKIRFPKFKVAGRLLQKKLGMRSLMDLIPLDTSLAKGSHGRVDLPRDLQPVVVTEKDFGQFPGHIACTDIHDMILQSLFID